MQKLVLIALMLPLHFLLATEPDTSRFVQFQEVTIVGDRAMSIPGSGSYIGSLQLQKLHQYDAQNVLRLVPGVTIRDEEGFGLRPNIGLRGTSVNRSEKITLMEDGILIAPAPYSDPAAYYFPTFTRMSGVEVLKGSSQIKYGPRTVGGAINFISTPIPTSFQGGAMLSYGRFNTNQQRLWLGDSRERLDYVFDVTRLASSGFKELDGGGNTGFDRRDVMGKIRFHTGDDASMYQALTLKFVNSTEDGNETYLGLTYDDYRNNPRRRYSGTQLDALDMYHNHLTLNHTIIPVTGLTISSTAYYSKSFREWARGNNFGGQSINNILGDPEGRRAAYNVMTGQADGTILYRATNRTYISKGIQFNTNYLFTKDELTHRIEFGIRHHYDQSDRFGTNASYNMTNGKMILDVGGIKGNSENQLRSATATSSFLTYDLKYKGLKLSPGVRYERISLGLENYGTADGERLGTALRRASNDLSVFLPGIGINYELGRESSIFGGIHRGFSPPGMPSVTSAEGQANPELSTNYELGFRHIANGFSMQATGFLNNFDNILGSDNVSGGGIGTGDMFNAGSALIKGMELSASVDVLNREGGTTKYKLPISIAYTYTSAIFQETFVNGGGDWGSGLINKGDNIPFVSPHMLTTIVGFEAGKIDISLTSRFTSETRVKPGANEKILPGDGVGFAEVNALPGFIIIDLAVNYRISKKLSVYSFVNNLMNNDAIVANLPQGFRPAMPLSFNIGLKANF